MGGVSQAVAAIIYFLLFAYSLFFKCKILQVSWKPIIQEYETQFYLKNIFFLFIVVLMAKWRAVSLATWRRQRVGDSNCKIHLYRFYIDSVWSNFTLFGGGRGWRGLKPISPLNDRIHLLIFAEMSSCFIDPLEKKRFKRRRRTSLLVNPSVFLALIQPSVTSFFMA